MNLQELKTISDQVVNQPWGVGDGYLQANSESWAPYLRFLHAVMRQYSINVALELGVYMGTATAHMSLGNPDATIIGVDREYHPNAFGVIRMYGNIIYLQGNTTSENVLISVDVLCQKFGKIGLMFIDSTHDGVTPKSEYEAYEHLFDDVCLVCCDDLIGPSHLHASMQEFWDWLPGDKLKLHHLHPRLNDSYDEPGFGVSIVRK